MIESIEELEALYGTLRAPSLLKVADRVNADYRAWIEASPFVALATVGPEGLDCSPRGDDGQVVFVVDENTLHLPDWTGNNRIDSLRNILRDGRLSLMFLIPGSGTVIRANGHGRIDADSALLQHYARSGKEPRSVLVVSVEEVYFQCARAVMRAGLWQEAALPELPSIGQMLKTLSKGAVGDDEYDKAWPKRARKNLW